MKRKKEIPINGIGIIAGYKVRAKEYKYSNDCSGCVFSLSSGYTFPCPKQMCDAKNRVDKTHVYFEKVEEGNDNENT